MNKLLTVALGAAIAVAPLLALVPAANAAEPTDCGSATSALVSAQTARDDAVADDDKAKKAKDADDAFDRADRDLRQANRRLTDAQTALTAHPSGDPGHDAAQKEFDSAQKAVDQATKERDRARKQADKENADQLQRKADKTDAVQLQKDLDAAKDDSNRLCSGATTTTVTTVTPAPAGDEFDCNDFPLSDGRTAQDVLNANSSDPNHLDDDRDGNACSTTTNLTGSHNAVTTPSGGVETGGGPA